MRYINDDIVLKNGGRYADKISKQDLMFLIDSKISWSKNESLVHKVNELLILPEIEKDLSKIIFDNENITTTDSFGNNAEGNPLIGFQTFENGFTFLGVEAGGDWEYPIFFIIYSSNEKLRAYIPSCGNMVNLDTKTAFGSELDSLQDENKLFLKYQKLGILPKDITSLTEFLSINVDHEAIYAKKYGIKKDDSNYGFNWNLIKSDIMSRIIIK